MKIYTISSSEGYGSPIKVVIVREDAGEPLLESDSPWLGSHALIFREAPVERIGPLLEPHGELLPLSCPDAELWMYNPLRVLDALDEGASSAVRFSNGRIMRINRYVLRREVIRNAQIFKLSCFRVSPT